MEVVAAIVVGLLAGALGGLFGVGGGLIFVPTLIFLGSNTHQAVATSLAAMIPAIVVGSWRQTRYGAVRWKEAAVIGVASIPTAQVGAAAANALSNDALRKAFAVLLFAVAVQMAVRVMRDGGPSDSPPGPDPPSA